MLSTLKLTSKTPLGKEEFKKVKTILQSLYDNHESFDFRMPVDWKSILVTKHSYGSSRLCILNKKSYGFRDHRYEVKR